jgi:SH3-like domain-containing protein
MTILKNTNKEEIVNELKMTNDISLVECCGNYYSIRTTVIDGWMERKDVVSTDPTPIYEVALMEYLMLGGKE